MAKVRVYELAKELGLTSKQLLGKLNDMGEYVKSASSTLETPVVRRVSDYVTKNSEGTQARQTGPQARRVGQEGRQAEPSPFRQGQCKACNRETGCWQVRCCQTSSAPDSTQCASRGTYCPFDGIVVGGPDVCDTTSRPHEGQAHHVAGQTCC